MLPTRHRLDGFPACVHLSITFNDHAAVYESVQDWCENHSEWLEWVSDDERDKAIASDSVWTCQWYPTTPVGFYVLAASSYDVLMRAVNEAVETPS